MAVTAIETDLQNELLRVLKEDIDYKVQDGDEGDVIVADAISYKRTPAAKNRSFEQSNQLQDVPGLIVSQPFHGIVDEGGGTNERDLWHYMWLIQLIDADLWDAPGRLATWAKWVEQIVSSMMFNCFSAVVQLPKGQIWWSRATPVDDVDENIWVKDAKFIRGIMVEIKVLQPRGFIE